MGLSITDVFTPAPASKWYQTLLDLGVQLGLTTTAWQPGGITRTILSIMSNALAQGDQVVSTMAQGGFLDFAASITPDPSVTPGAPPGWLDICADSGFDIQRDPATFATGPVELRNSSASTYGPYAPGTYHIDNPTTKQGYHNTATVTVAASVVTVATFEADIAGAAGSSAPGNISHASTSNSGVVIYNKGSLVGNNAESNAALVARCRASQAARSPNGPKDAYNYFAKQAYLLLAALDANGNPVLPTLPGTPVIISAVTRTLVESDTFTGTVTTTVANANGSVPGVVNVTITGAVSGTAGKVRLTCASTSAMTTGMWGTVSGVVGTSEANVTTTITVHSGTTFELDGTTFANAYVSGGVAEVGDLGQVDRIIQANVVPDGITALTQTASDNSLSVRLDIWLPSVYSAQVQMLATQAVTQYFGVAPIGGYTDPNGAYANVIPLDAVIGIGFAAGVIAPGQASVVQQCTALLAGVAANYTLGAHDVAEPSSILVVAHLV